MKHLVNKGLLPMWLKKTKCSVKFHLLFTLIFVSIPEFLAAQEPTLIDHQTTIYKIKKGAILMNMAEGKCFSTTI